MANHTLPASPADRTGAEPDYLAGVVVLFVFALACVVVMGAVVLSW